MIPDGFLLLEIPKANLSVRANTRVIPAYLAYQPRPFSRSTKSWGGA